MTERHLPKDIALLLCAKLAALGILYFAFFSPATHPPSDARAVSARMLSPDTSL